MFVVRIVVDEEKTDYKVFEGKPSAQQRFDAAASMAFRDEIEHVTLFEVARDNVREAVDAIKRGERNGVALVAQELNSTLRILKLADKLDLDL